MLYVDDMLIVRQDLRKIASLKKASSKSFAIKDMGPTKKILGMHIVGDKTKKMLWRPREIRDKGDPEIQHAECQADRLDIADE